MVEVGEEGDSERPGEDHSVDDDVVERKSLDVVQRHSDLVFGERRIGEDLALDAVILVVTVINMQMGGKGNGKEERASTMSGARNPFFLLCRIAAR